MKTKGTKETMKTIKAQKAQKAKRIAMAALALALVLSLLLAGCGTQNAQQTTEPPTTTQATTAEATTAATTAAETTSQAAAAQTTAAATTAATTTAAPTTTAQTTTAAPAGEPPLVITLMAAFFSDTEPYGTSGVEINELLKWMEETFNIDLQITWSPGGDYTEKFNAVMASNNVPMVIAVSSGTTANANYIDMLTSGVFWDMTEYIPQYPNIANKLITPGAMKATSIGGHNYGIPMIASGARLGVLYRADWADNLGLESPQTIDKFRTMIEAFATQDPDGNGQNDTIGFAYCDSGDGELSYAGFDLVNAWMGGPVGWGLTDDNKLMPYYFFDSYFDTLDLFAWMYSNGYMNSDFAINTDKHGPMRNNITGMMTTSATAAASNDYDNLNGLVGEGVWSLKSEQELYDVNGKRFMSSTQTTTSLGTVLLPKLSVRDEATVRRILQFFNDLYEGDNEMVMDLGFEGYNYLRDASGKVMTQEEIIAARGQDFWDTMYNRMDEWYMGWASLCFPRKILAADWGQEFSLGQIITMKAVENEQYVVADLSMGYMDIDAMSTMTQIATIISDARVKFIMGQIDKDGFIAARDEWLAAGGQAVIDSVNAAYAAGN